jgi:hypothetical protein
MIKPDQLERLKDRVKGLPLGHRSYTAAPSLKSPSFSHRSPAYRTDLKDRAQKERKFIELYDEIFGQKPRSTLSKLDPPIGRAILCNHHRISRLYRLKERKRAWKGYFRSSKRFKRCHLYIKSRPVTVGAQNKVFRMGGMGTMMRVSSLGQDTDWRIAEKDRRRSTLSANNVWLTGFR